MLDRYLKEIKRHPLLPHAEQARLAARYRTLGDEQALAKLITCNLRLVVRIAHQMHQRPERMLDLIQAGNWGLIEAARRYDPTRPCSFCTYAGFWVRARMFALLLQERLVRIGTTVQQRKVFFNLRKLERQMGEAGPPSEESLALVLRVPVGEVKQMSRRIEPEACLDQARLADPGPSPEAQAARLDLQRKVAAAVDVFEQTLDPRARSILRKRLLASKPEGLRALGEAHGCSRERIRQIEVRVIEGLRHHLRQALGDPLAYVEVG
jgi:RNA polymerase sigma-32 factor